MHEPEEERFEPLVIVRLDQRFRLVELSFALFLRSHTDPSAQGYWLGWAGVSILIVVLWILFSQRTTLHERGLPS